MTSTDVRQTRRKHPDEDTVENFDLDAVRETLRVESISMMDAQASQTQNTLGTFRGLLCPAVAWLRSSPLFRSCLLVGQGCGWPAGAFVVALKGPVNSLVGLGLFLFNQVDYLGSSL